MQSAYKGCISRLCVCVYTPLYTIRRAQRIVISTSSVYCRLTTVMNPLIWLKRRVCGGLGIVAFSLNENYDVGGSVRYAHGHRRTVPWYSGALTQGEIISVPGRDTCERLSGADFHSSVSNQVCSLCECINLRCTLQHAMYTGM